MALGETAVLAVELKINGVTAYKSGVAEAEAATAGLNKTVAKSTNILGGTASNLSLVKQAAVSTGTAFKGMGTHLKGVLTGPLGMLGLGAGIFSVTKFLTDAVDEAAKFSESVMKVTAVTNLGTPAASALVDTLDKWGVSSERLIPILGKLEKNVGSITEKTGAAKKFQNEYGVSLLDSKGKIADANELLLRSADYFTSSATATQKATFMSKLYGKGWQDLIPILAKGSDFIKSQEADAIHLTDAQIANSNKYRGALRDFQDAFGDAQVKIGATIMPGITDALKSVTAWLDANTDKVTVYFDKGLTAAREFGGFLTGTIIPTLHTLASAAIGFWNAIPAPLRDIIAKGFIADRTIHFLFGVSPLNLAKNLLGSIAGSLFQRGGTPATPLFVADVTGGLGKGVGNLLPGVGGAGGAGLLSTAASLLAPVAAAAALIVGTKLLTDALDPGSGAALNQGAASGYIPLGNRDPRRFDANGNPVRNFIPVAGLPVGDGTHPGREQGAPRPSQAPFQVERAAQNIADSAAFFGNKVRMSFRGFQDLYDRERKLLGYTVVHGHTVGGQNAIASLTRLKGSDVTLVADALAAKFTRSNRPFYTSTLNEQRTLAALQKAQTAAIKRGDTDTAKALGHDINVLKTDLGKKTDRVNNTIHNKKTSFTVHNTIKNSFGVDGRVIAANIQRYVAVYGSGRIGIGGQIQ